jgi:hypothetical protein
MKNKRKRLLRRCPKCQEQRKVVCVHDTPEPREQHFAIMVLDCGHIHVASGTEIETLLKGNYWWRGWYQPASKELD